MKFQVLFCCCLAVATAAPSSNTKKTEREGKNIEPLPQAVENTKYTTLHRAAPVQNVVGLAPVQYSAVNHAFQPIVAGETYAQGQFVAPAFYSNNIAQVQAVYPVPVAQQYTAVAQPVPFVRQQTLGYRTVDLEDKIVHEPRIRTDVTVPIHKQVHYGTEQYIAGHSTQLHKPSLRAPVISPPALFKQRVTVNAPEIEVVRPQHHVVKSVPQFIEKPVAAGSIIEQTLPEINSVAVPTPYKVITQQVEQVAQPVPVVTKETHPVHVSYSAPHVLANLHGVHTNLVVPHAIPVEQKVQLTSNTNSETIVA